MQLGWDTAVRVLNPRYYQGEAGLAAAMGAIREQRCSFLVAGRVEGDVFRTLADVDIPQSAQGLFAPIPEAQFREDVSSTALRAAGHGLQ